MNTHLIHSPEAWLNLLLQPSAKAAVLAAIAILLTFALRRWMAPRWRHLLWVLVFARLVVPDLGSSYWSAYAWNVEPHPEVPAKSSPLVQMPETLALERGNHQLSADGPVPEQEKAAASGKNLLASPPSTHTWVKPMTNWQLAGLVWLGGSLLMLGLMVACWLRFHRRILRDATPASPEWLRELEALRLQHGWRRTPALLFSPHLDSPVLAGLWRPRIVLPTAQSLQHLTTTQRRHLLLHEMAHARCGDLWLHTAASILLAIHWFNPLLWLACRRLRAEAEACADAWVVRHEGQNQARDYGNTLLHLVVQSASAAVLLFSPGVLGMAGAAGELKERLTELALGQHRKGLWTMVAMALIALTATATFTRPTTVQASAQAKAESASIHGRVVDETGQPVQGATLSLRSPNFPLTIETTDTVSDAEGRFRFDGQIQDQTLTLSYRHSDHAESPPQLVTAGHKEDILLVLKPLFQLSGIITRAEDGQPVAHARVFVGQNVYGNSYRWTAGKPVHTDPDGRYQLSYKVMGKGVSLLRVESPSHATFIAPLPDAPASQNQMDAQLLPLKNLEGSVLDDQGKPVSGALVWMAEGDSNLSQAIHQEWIESQVISEDASILNKTVADKEGRFRLKEAAPFFADKVTVIAVTPETMGHASLTHFRKTSALRLEKWNILQGQFKGEDGQPLANKKLWVNCEPLPANQKDVSSSLRRSLTGTTDAEGKLIFDQILPHSQTTVRGGQVAPSQTLSFNAGETRQVSSILKSTSPKSEAASGRRQVTGQVILLPGIADTLIGAKINLSKVGEPTRPQTALCSADGHFVISNVAPGHYLLSASLTDPEKPYKVFNEIASVAIEFSFEEEVSKTEFELGLLHLKKFERPSFLTSRPSPLPLPKGPEGEFTLTFEDAQGQPVNGVAIVGALIDQKQRAVYDRQGLVNIPPLESGADGTVKVKFQRDLPGLSPVAGVRVHVEKPGFITQSLVSMADGESSRIQLQQNSFLEVSGMPTRADLAANLTTFSSAAAPFQRSNERHVASVAAKGLQPFIITDRTDSQRWRFSTMTMADFAPGKPQVAEPVFTKGVAIQGHITGLPHPVQGDAWAHAEVELEAPLPAGTTRVATTLGGNQPRSLMRMHWAAWCPVNPDGTFFFPGVPHGKLNLQVIGPGWVMDEEPENGGLYRGRSLTASDEVLRVTRGIRPAGKKRIKVITPDGSPATEAQVRFYRTSKAAQNAYGYRRTQKPFVHVPAEHRQAYEKWLKGETPGHVATTGPDGIAVMDNLPEGNSDFSITWKNPQTGRVYQRNVSGPTGPGTDDPYVVGVSNAEARE